MKVAVVIPSFRVKNKILSVIQRIDERVHRIYVVDDCCPQSTGNFVAENCNDERVCVLFNKVNMGVGGAVCSVSLSLTGFVSDTLTT